MAGFTVNDLIAELEGYGDEVPVKIVLTQLKEDLVFDFVIDDGEVDGVHTVQLTVEAGSS